MYSYFQLTILTLSLIAIGCINLYSQEDKNDTIKLHLPEHFTLDNKEQFHELEKFIELANRIIESVKNKDTEKIPTFLEKYQTRGAAFEYLLHYHLTARTNEVVLRDITINVLSDKTKNRSQPFVRVLFYPHSFQPSSIDQYRLFGENSFKIGLYKNGCFSDLSVGNIVGDDDVQINDLNELREKYQNKQLSEKNKPGKLVCYWWNEQGQLTQSTAYSYSTMEELEFQIWDKWKKIIIKK